MYADQIGEFVSGYRRANQKISKNFGSHVAYPTGSFPILTVLLKRLFVYLVGEFVADIRVPVI